jgi:hypothetical protein
MADALRLHMLRDARQADRELAAPSPPIAARLDPRRAVPDGREDVAANQLRHLSQLHAATIGTGAGLRPAAGGQPTLSLSENTLGLRSRPLEKPPRSSDPMNRTVALTSVAIRGVHGPALARRRCCCLCGMWS